MRSFLRRHLKVVGGAAVVGLGVSAALAVATVPDNQGVIHSCYRVLTIAGTGFVEPDASGPNLKVIDPGASASQTCGQDERPLAWNQQGTVGPAGPPGAPGQQAASGECRTTVGHLTLNGKPALSTDICAARLVRLGTTTGARAQSQAGTTQYEVSRGIDSISPKLAKACANGTHFKSATIQIYKPGTTTVLSHYNLNDAAISSYKQDLGLSQPSETMTLIALLKKGV